MDKIDNKIISELDRNPRIPLSQLAKKVRTSQQVADYRIQRLMKNKVIAKFGTIINLKALKQEHYRVFFTFNSKKEYSNDKIFAYLKKEKGVYWTARIGGKYDLLIVLFVYDFSAFDSFIDRFNAEFPGLIKDYKGVYGIKHDILGHKYLNNKETHFQYGYNDKIQEIDELDLSILRDLKDNCRLSSLEISKGKNVSYKTIINRIKSMEKRKIILGYRLFMGGGEFKPFIILFSFKNYSKRAEHDLLFRLKSDLRVTQIIKLFGIWDLFIHVRAENNESAQNMLVEFRDKYDIIDNYEILPVFEDVSINLMPL